MKTILLTVPLTGVVLTACQPQPSISDVTEAYGRANATVTAIEFGEAYSSTESEKIIGVPSNVTIYLVKVSCQFPAWSGAASHQTVNRNVDKNVFGELVCD